MNEQSRINAMIGYFFLAPLFLLVREGSPYSEAYVRGHAKRASAIMLGSIIIIGLYMWLLKPVMNIQVIWFSLHSIVLTTMMTLLSGLLIHGAYRAYHGIDARSIETFSLRLTTEQVHGTYSEEEKIRILASFIPFVGIFIAHKYPLEPYITGRKVGSSFAFVFITLVWIYGGTVSTLVFAITLVAIVLFIITALYLFLYDVFLSLSVYAYLPTYSQIEAHIRTSIVTVFDFFRIAFGGTKKSDYKSSYQQTLGRYEAVQAPTVPYILPTWLIGIPLINLVTLPSLWMQNIREYRLVILQGLFISLLAGLILSQIGLSSILLLYLCFPATTLMVYGGHNTLIRAPFTSWIISLSSLFTRGQQKVRELGEKKEDVSFTYEEK